MAVKQRQALTERMKTMVKGTPLTHLIQTHGGVSILPNTWNYGAWIDSHVYGSPLPNLGVSVNMTDGTGLTLYVELSHDGVNKFASVALYDGANSDYATGHPDKDVHLSTRYFRVAVKNKDATNPKVTNAYAYLKD
jgi:hypothetical protein